MTKQFFHLAVFEFMNGCDLLNNVSAVYNDVQMMSLLQKKVLRYECLGVCLRNQLTDDIMENLFNFTVKLLKRNHISLANLFENATKNETADNWYSFTCGNSVSEE